LYIRRSEERQAERGLNAFERLLNARSNACFHSKRSAVPVPIGTERNAWAIFENPLHASLPTLRTDHPTLPPRRLHSRKREEFMTKIIAIAPLPDSSPEGGDDYLIALADDGSLWRRHLWKGQPAEWREIDPPPCCRPAPWRTR
jgi:hypothetical protein